MRIQDKYDLVLFDGVCNLCNRSVNFIIKRDYKDKFKFGALQDASSHTLLKAYFGNNSYLDSLVLIRGEKVYLKSRAALEIAKILQPPWPLVYIFRIIPTFLRDPIYNWIAKNRYSWFGKQDSCRVPTANERRKFLSNLDY